MKSVQFKDEGRTLERLHYETEDWAYNLKAAAVYEQAIFFHLANHHAWANRAWRFWKRRVDRRAIRCIDAARAMCPTSTHVQDVRDRIVAGKRSMQ